MLLLDRDASESLIIGDNIEVKLLWIKGKTATLGIEAPKLIPVHRKEIYEKIQKQERIKEKIDGYGR